MQSVSPTELKILIDTPATAPVLVDVREPWELSICQLEGCRNLPMGQIAQRIDELDPNATTVVICHHGVRSYQVAAFLEQAGFSDVSNLEGGIDAWAEAVDPGMARY